MSFFLRYAKSLRTIKLTEAIARKNTKAILITISFTKPNFIREKAYMAANIAEHNRLMTASLTGELFIPGFGVQNTIFLHFYFSFDYRLVIF